jgi:hypothetical protein
MDSVFWPRSAPGFGLGWDERTRAFSVHKTDQEKQDVCLSSASQNFAHAAAGAMAEHSIPRRAQGKCDVWTVEYQSGKALLQ